MKGLLTHQHFLVRKEEGRKAWHRKGSKQRSFILQYYRCGIKRAAKAEEEP